MPGEGGKASGSRGTKGTGLARSRVPTAVLQSSPLHPSAHEAFQPRKQAERSLQTTPPQNESREEASRDYKDVGEARAAEKLTKKGEQGLR